MLPPPAPVVTVHADYGGVVADYARRVLQYKGRRVRVRIDGECDSACTMLAGLGARVCVTPATVLGFHQAYLQNPFDPLDTTMRADDATKVMAGFYPPQLKAWIAANGGLRADMIVLQGAELAQVLPLCK